jgi:biofilm PGA synthesis protein PgaD
MNPLVINRPHLQRPVNRAMWATVTWAFWILWMYLWLPVITIVGWYFGIHSSLDQMVERLGYLEFLRLLPRYVMVVAGAGLALVVWSYVQYRRFHGRERRTHRAVAGTPEIAAHLGLCGDALSGWQSERRLTAFHEQDGRLIRVQGAEEPSLMAAE